jgi:hypothetical protein
MTSSQVRAALGLLKKVLPDLSSTTLATEDGGPTIVHLITVYEAAPGEKTVTQNEQFVLDKSRT